MPDERFRASLPIAAGSQPVERILWLSIADHHRPGRSQPNQTEPSADP